jgi:hypothetical protein
MRSAIDPIKLLASRFASLPPLARMKVTERLLRWRDERQEANEHEQRAACSDSRRQSFPEKFWDEVEAAHGDGLYPANPFADESAQLLPLAAKETLRPYAA